MISRSISGNNRGKIVTVAVAVVYAKIMSLNLYMLEEKPQRGILVDSDMRGRICKNLAGQVWKGPVGFVFSFKNIPHKSAQETKLVIRIFCWEYGMYSRVSAARDFLSIG